MVLACEKYLEHIEAAASIWKPRLIGRTDHESA